jgi:hypothetical protein
VPIVPVIIMMVVVTMTLIIAGVIPWSDDHDHGGLRLVGRKAASPGRARTKRRKCFIV